MVLSKLAPSNIKNINDKISYAIRIYGEFIDDQLIEK
jgi:hypothetical protein